MTSGPKSLQLRQKDLNSVVCQTAVPAKTVRNNDAINSRRVKLSIPLTTFSEQNCVQRRKEKSLDSGQKSLMFDFLGKNRAASLATLKTTHCDKVEHRRNNSM